MNPIPRALGRTLLALPWLVLAPPAAPGADASFRRGDVNIDGEVDLADAMRLKDIIGSGTADLLSCRDAADVNDDGMVEYSDIVELVESLLKPERPIPPPSSKDFGVDPTPDGLDCATYDLVNPEVREGLRFDLVPDPADPQTDLYRIGVRVTLTVPSSDGRSGLEGWSFGLLCEGGIVEDVGQNGLRVAAVDPRVADELELDLEDVGVAWNSDGSDTGQAGAVVALSLDRPLFLAPGRTHTIAYVGLRRSDPSSRVTLRFHEGEAAPGESFKTMVSWRGDSQAPRRGEIVFDGIEPGFQRPGDADQNGTLDISDAVWLIGHLYLGQFRVLPCEGGTAAQPGAGELALLDSNGDGMLDLSDAVSVLSWLFLGGTPPHLGLECVRTGCRRSTCGV